jgi:hypothetical protein
MLDKYFKLVARVSSSNLQSIIPVLENLITKGSVTEVEEEFLVEAEMKGESAKELNSFLLCSLRRVEKRTRLRAEWTSEDGITQRFSNYVLKKIIESE